VIQRSPIELSIVMPCLNEALTLAACIKQAQQALADSGIQGEVIVADNGSTDGSREIAVAHGARLVPVPARGYGYALQAGIAAAHGRYILMGDADCSYDFSHATRFVTELHKGFDLVMGNRFAGGIKPGAMPWKNRYIGNPILTAIGRLFFRCPCRDFHCGLRAFTKAAYEKMGLRTGGMEFASEMVIRATLLRLRITEIPTTLSPDGRDRAPHLRPWRDGWRHLRFMLLFSPRWLFLYPGVVLMLIGAVLGGILVRGPLPVGRITLDVHTLFFCACAVLIGFQSVLFAVLTKVFAVETGLAPVDPFFARWVRRISLEVGLLIGGALLLTGLGLSLAAVSYWGRHNFGDLSPTAMLRWVIPAGTLLALGCQVALGSFFLSVLGLKFAKR
jgi:glycosyltransferase involved in cell wall biosynthesis